MCCAASAISDTLSRVGGGVTGLTSSAESQLALEGEVDAESQTVIFTLHGRSWTAQDIMSRCGELDTKRACRLSVFPNSSSKVRSAAGSSLNATGALDQKIGITSRAERSSFDYSQLSNDCSHKLSWCQGTHQAKHRQGY